MGVGVVPQPSRFKRAGNSLYLENVPNQQWPLGQPIQYMFDVSVTCEFDKKVKFMRHLACLNFPKFHNFSLNKFYIFLT